MSKLEKLYEELVAAKTAQIENYVAMVKQLERRIKLLETQNRVLTIQGEEAKRAFFRQRARVTDN